MESSEASWEAPTIPYLRLRAELEACEPVRLPGFKGSTLRGALGHALRRLVCVADHRQTCRDCRLRATCTYTALFEPLAEDATDRGPLPAAAAGMVEAPRPYVIECGNRRRTFEAGDRLSFDLLLLGRGVELQSFAVVALERMGEPGLGAERGRFRLERVSAQTADGTFEDGYLRGRRRWSFRAPLMEPLGLTLGSDGPDQLRRLRLRFVTPLRLAHGGRILDQIPLDRLVASMEHRSRCLGHFYSPQGAETSARSQAAEGRPEGTLGPRALEGVRVTASRLRWCSLHRRSNRQRHRLPCGGVLGEMELQGRVAPLLPLFRLAQLAHVGKGTTFGLGQVEVTA